MASQGPNNPGASVNGGLGTISWSDPENVFDSDDSRAVATWSLSSDSTEALHVTDFGFSISDDPDGIEVTIERHKSGGTDPADSVVDYFIQLLIGGTESGDNKAFSGTEWPGADAVQTYGGSSNLWGLTTPTAAQINSSNFGVSIRALIHSESSSSIQAHIDHVTIKVFYPGGDPVTITLSPHDIVSEASCSFVVNTNVTVDLSPHDFTSESSLDPLVYGFAIALSPSRINLASELRAGHSVTVALAEPLSLDMELRHVDTLWSYNIQVSGLTWQAELEGIRTVFVVRLSPLELPIESSFTTLYGSNITLSPADVISEAAHGMLYDVILAISPADIYPSDGGWRVIPNYGPSARVYQEESQVGQTVMGVANEPFKLNRSGTATHAGGSRPLHLSVAKPTVVEVHGMFTIDTPVPLPVDGFYYLSPGQYLRIRNDVEIIAAITQDGDTEEITLTPTPMTGIPFSLKMASIEQP